MQDPDEWILFDSLNGSMEPVVNLQYSFKVSPYNDHFYNFNILFSAFFNIQVSMFISLTLQGDINDHESIVKAIK
jgi:hypothetical protein